MTCPVQQNYIEQAVYDKKDLPAPGASQPKHAKYHDSIARKTSASLHPHAGRMAMSKSKNYIEQAVYEKSHMPAPGNTHFKHGFTSLKSSGGTINAAKSKNCECMPVHAPCLLALTVAFPCVADMEQHVYERSHIPAPGHAQAKHGRAQEACIQDQVP